jgi:hypothetical protein
LKSRRKQIPSTGNIQRRGDTSPARRVNAEISGSRNIGQQ